MSVVVLDEAGMVGTRDLAELARHAEEAGAKLALERPRLEIVQVKHYERSSSASLRAAARREKQRIRVFARAP